MKQLSKHSIANYVFIEKTLLMCHLIAVFEDLMRAYLLQLRQELGNRLFERVFESSSDRPSKVRFYDMFPDRLYETF